MLPNKLPFDHPAYEAGVGGRWASTNALAGHVGGDCSMPNLTIFSHHTPIDICICIHIVRNAIMSLALLRVRVRVRL